MGPEYNMPGRGAGAQHLNHYRAQAPVGGSVMTSVSDFADCVRKPILRVRCDVPMRTSGSVVCDLRTSRIVTGVGSDRVPRGLSLIAESIPTVSEGMIFDIN